jgi:hypothetical protein
MRFEAVARRREEWCRSSLNPFGLRVWAYELSTNPSVRNGVLERAPVTPTTYHGLIIICSLIALTAYFARSRTPIDVGSLVTLGVFLLMALIAQRAAVWWAIVMPPAMAHSSLPGMA